MDEACRLRQAEGYGACEDEAPLFSPFFSGKTEKNGLPEAQSQCNCNRGSPVNSDKRADVGIGPYNILCRIVCEATVAVSLQKRQFR